MASSAFSAADDRSRRDSRVSTGLWVRRCITLSVPPMGPNLPGGNGNGDREDAKNARRKKKSEVWNSRSARTSNLTSQIYLLRAFFAPSRLRAFAVAVL